MLWTATILGLGGSLHCLGMCGPLALTLPAGNRRSLLYNLGRLGTYSFIGAIWGVMGQGIAMAGYQQGLSITVGIVMLAILLFSLKMPYGLAFKGLGAGLYVKLKKNIGHLLQVKSDSSVFLLGVLNGFLPCGLVYMALMGAAATGSYWQGAAFMALFGLGTWPMMFAIRMSGGKRMSALRKYQKPLVWGLSMSVAVLLIVRGMGLDIPYLSPDLQALVMGPEQCGP